MTLNFEISKFVMVRQPPVHNTYHNVILFFPSANTMVVKFQWQSVDFNWFSFRCTLPKKWSFPLRISSVNVTKSAGNWSFPLSISLVNVRRNSNLLKKSLMKTSFFVQWQKIRISHFWKLLFPEMRVTRKIFTWAVAHFFLIDFKSIFLSTFSPCFLPWQYV